MKKFLSIVLTFVMIASLFTVTASAVEVGQDLKPSFSVEIEKVVESTNKAWVNIYFSTSEDLDYTSSTVEDDETGEEVTTYVGKSASMVQAEISLNSKYFTVAKDTVSFTSSAKYDSNDTTAVLDDLALSYVHQGAATAGIVGNNVKLCRAIVPVNGTYTADELNAATDLFTLSYATVTISEYAEGTTDANAIAVQTNYSTNKGVANYDIVIEEDEPEPDLEKTVTGGTLDDAAKTKTYELTVGADLKDTGVTAVLTHEDYPEDPQEVGLTFSGWAGEAKAVFNVVVKFLDYTANASKVSLSIK